MRAALVAAKTLLVLVTLVFLASMGGGMLVAGWFLVPLHWWAARDAGPIGTAGWTLLAGMSVGEVAWMLGYVLAGETAGGVAGVAGLVGTATAFYAARLRRITATSS